MQRNTKRSLKGGSAYVFIEKFFKMRHIVEWKKHVQWKKQSAEQLILFGMICLKGGNRITPYSKNFITSKMHVFSF